MDTDKASNPSGAEKHPDHSPVDTGRFYACIDLKSFYASVECVQRGLDPFAANLVVADPSRGPGGICLAVSPAMKAQGVPNRCRVFEIPRGMSYITAVPRMRLYMRYSADIYSIYLRYVSPEDIFPYSIDECFIDITSYLSLYGAPGSPLQPQTMARLLMDAILHETGICATAGVGTNLFLAKIALDITAKHAPDRIGYLDEALFQKTLWHHRPLTDFWRIGHRMSKRLEKKGLMDLYAVAHCPEEILYHEFGVTAEYLIDHAWGYEPCAMWEIQKLQPETRSVSNGQILFEDYSFEDGRLVMREMADMLILEIVEKGCVCGGVSVGVGYSKGCRKSTGANRKMSSPTHSGKKLLAALTECYESSTDRNAPIRQITVSLTNLRPEGEGAPGEQISLFAAPIWDSREERQEQELQKTLISIRHKFGKNAVMRGMSYLPRATGLMRNQMVGGHRGGTEGLSSSQDDALELAEELYLAERIGDR